MQDYLFSEFPEVSANEWKDQIIKDLKGKSFDSLFWDTHLGIQVKPFYTQEDTPKASPPLFTKTNWSACEFINADSEKEANRLALEALGRGTGGLIFHLHKKTDIAQLTSGISLEHIYTQFNLSNHSSDILEKLKDTYGSINAYENRKMCFLNVDPVFLLAYYGEWHTIKEEDLKVLSKLYHIPVDATIYTEAGAGIVYSTALALAHLNEYLNYLQEHPNSAIEHIHISVSIGGDFFMEIARLRALRKLVSFIQKQYSQNRKLHVHAQTSLLNKSRTDAYNNMLRTTTEAMSAIIGGCDSLCIFPYNSSFEKETNFSRRIAINQQHILRDEAFLNKVADVAAGSYYLENLTEELAKKAWEAFLEIESQGGLIASLEKNSIQEKLEKDFLDTLNRYRQGEEIVVGKNKYQNPKEEIYTPKSYLPKSGKLCKRLLQRSIDEL